MGNPLRVLIVEDAERDAALLLRELRRGRYELTFKRVETAEGMTAALEKQPWDIVISDYGMPQFSALKALALMKEKGLELPFIVTADISDSKRVEEAREQFIGNFAHDLRNPLSAIEGTAVLLGRAEDIPERHARNFARIARSTRRMSAMIRDVLDFTRGRLGGGIPIEREQCDLGDICAEAVAEMKQAYPGRAIHCDATGSLGGGWDSARIEQMLSNLIGNAVQHGLDPIRVSASADHDGGVIVAVTNLGAPIPAGLIPTLFGARRHDLHDPVATPHARPGAVHGTAPQVTAKLGRAACPRDRGLDAFRPPSRNRQARDPACR